MKRIVFTVLFLITPALVLASPAVDKRLDQLEKKQAELYHTLAEKKQSGLAGKITEKITISGLIEVEAGLEGLEYSDGRSEATSDIVLATAQLGLGADIAEGVFADLSLLYEEGATDLEVDEAAISFSNDTWFARVGQQYVPFGVFHSHFISDPLTLELGETRETAALAGYGNDLLRVSAFIFNGDAGEKDDGEDHIRDWGVALDLSPLENLALGASYTSDLADSDAELTYDEVTGQNNYEKRVGGWSAFFVYEPGAFDLSGEVLGAVSDFAAVDSVGQSDRPLAWNVELAWYPSDFLEVALRYEGSDEFAGRPETQYGICASWGIRDNVSLSLEYLHGEFDSVYGFDEEDNLIDSRELVTAQLGLEF